MDADQAPWVVHRHVIDPCLGELEVSTRTSASDHRPMMPIGPPRDLWDLDARGLEELTLQDRSILALVDEVTSDR